MSIKSKRGLVRTKDGKLELEHWGAEKRDVHTNKYIYQELFSRVHKRLTRYIDRYRAGQVNVHIIVQRHQHKDG